MPKIEVVAENLYRTLGKRLTDSELESLLTAAKAELDGKDEEAGILKIELNDTNRPDLWSTAGLVRQLSGYLGRDVRCYDFFSTSEEVFETGERVVTVDPDLLDTRPYIVAFAVSGKAVDEPTLMDLIQTQEKLCWNYGRKRSAIAMGVYRSDLITYPVRYVAADPLKTSFIPLQSDRELNLVEVLDQTPKGQEFGHIVRDFTKYPFITDDNGKVLSFPPIINSAEVGAVQVGDNRLFIELTGTELKALIHTASIVACDLADDGFTIEPVKIIYPYDTEFGRELVIPYYFQSPAAVSMKDVCKLLGAALSPDEALAALRRMGVFGLHDSGSIYVTVPEYRNDFLHPVDIIEDIMIGHGMDRFEPEMPDFFTPGRLTAEEEFSRKAKEIMIGMGYQEMMYNYLGSARDFIHRMMVSSEGFIQVENPMSENYEYVRKSIIPSLLQSEAVSSNAVYPHRIFEIGKAAYADGSEPSGTSTKNYLAFLQAERGSGFNQIASQISGLLYYLSREYSLKDVQDSRFIPGRAAEVICAGKTAGIFGEVHPQVLENWGIQMPCSVCEIDLDLLL